MNKLLISPETTIKEAMKTLNSTGEKCLVIVDDQQRLLGTLSGGDLRKAILNGASINNSIKEYYYSSPTSFVEGGYTLIEAKTKFIQSKFDLIPIVDEKNKVVNILFWEKVFQNGIGKQPDSINAPVVIMAGGKGTRMEPFTKVLPKPLVPIHEKPVIEHIIERFTKAGADDFYLTVNYKSRILKAYFEEIESDYRVHFVDEQKPLGTAGSLQFLKGHFETPFFVTNCDIIIDADYADLYNFHLKHEFAITLIASAKEYIIPYGTCELNGDGHLDCMNEKPQYNFLINTGFYILNPDALDLIPENAIYHMTDLIKDAKRQGMRVGVYPIDDDAWIDIGQWAEYRKAVERL